MHNAIIGLPKPDIVFCGTAPPSPQVPQKKAGNAAPTAQPGPKAVAMQQARRTRHRRVRCYWRQAKRLSQTIKDQDLRAWLIRVSNAEFRALTPLEKIKELLKIRQVYARTYNYAVALKLDAALWRELTTLRTSKNRTNDQKNSQKRPAVRLSVGREQ